MSYFWLEYLHFDAMMLGILVSVSSAALFLLTYKYEKRLRTIWRSLGFLSLAVAFFLFILERKFPALGLPALFVELLGFFSIYKGVRAEPQLAILQRVGAPDAAEIKKQTDTHVLDAKAVSQILFFAVLLPLLGYLFIAFTDLGPWVPVIVQGLATFFIILTIPIQITRYRTESKDAKTKRQNLWPLVGYLFLLVMGVLAIFYRLPALSTVSLRNATLNFSGVWITSIIFLFLGFFFLAIWAWNFIKLRVFLRTYVVFLAIAIFVSSLGSAFFTQLIFSIIENNNLTLMSQATRAVETIVEDRQKSAAFSAFFLAQDKDIIDAARFSDVNKLTEKTAQSIAISGVNYVRVYDASGKVIFSPQDTRDVGTSYVQDDLVAYVLGNKPINSLDTIPGVQSSYMVARALEPLTFNDSVVGAIELGHIFDTPFTDLAKNKIGLEVSVYAGDKISATTIVTDDGKSRWIGSREPNPIVLDTVYGKGKDIALALDRLGRPYYSAFLPLVEVNGNVIGMVSVGTPTYLLFEASRQQLISTFLVSSIVALIAAFIGYLAMRSYRSKNPSA